MESEARILAFVGGGVSLRGIGRSPGGLPAGSGRDPRGILNEVRGEDTGRRWRIAQKSPPRRAAEVFVNPRAPNDVHRPLRCEDVERRQPLTGCAEATSTDRPRHVGDGRA